jgi:hypothetical protein
MAVMLQSLSDTFYIKNKEKVFVLKYETSLNNPVTATLRI